MLAWLQSGELHAETGTEPGDSKQDELVQKRTVGDFVLHLNLDLCTQHGVRISFFKVTMLCCAAFIHAFYNLLQPLSVILCIGQ